jgi:hypothetical protein
MNDPKVTVALPSNIHVGLAKAADYKDISPSIYTHRDSNKNWNGEGITPYTPQDLYGSIFYRNQPWYEAWGNIIPKAVAGVDRLAANTIDLGRSVLTADGRKRAVLGGASSLASLTNDVATLLGLADDPLKTLISDLNDSRDKLESPRSSEWSAELRRRADDITERNDIFDSNTESNWTLDANFLPRLVADVASSATESGPSAGVFAKLASRGAKVLSGAVNSRSLAKALPVNLAKQGLLMGPKGEELFAKGLTGFITNSMEGYGMAASMEQEMMKGFEDQINLYESTGGKEGLSFDEARSIARLQSDKLFRANKLLMFTDIFGFRASVIKRATRNEIGDELEKLSLKHRAKEALKDSGAETFEEMSQGGLQEGLEAEGTRMGQDVMYNTGRSNKKRDEFKMADDIFEYLKDGDNWYEGFVGAASGPLQSTIGAIPATRERAAYREFLNRGLEEQAKVVGSFTETLKKGLGHFDVITRQMQAAIDAGEMPIAEFLKEHPIYNQMYFNFKMGTAHRMENILQGIIDAKPGKLPDGTDFDPVAEYGENYRERAQILLNDMLYLENRYNKALDYENANKVALNEFNRFKEKKYISHLERYVEKSRKELQDDINEIMLEVPPKERANLDVRVEQGGEVYIKNKKDGADEKLWSIDDTGKETLVDEANVSLLQQIKNRITESSSFNKYMAEERAIKHRYRELRKLTEEWGQLVSNEAQMEAIKERKAVEEAEKKKRAEQKASAKQKKNDKEKKTGRGIFSRIFRKGKDKQDAQEAAQAAQDTPEVVPDIKPPETKDQPPADTTKNPKKENTEEPPAKENNGNPPKGPDAKDAVVNGTNPDPMSPVEVSGAKETSLQSRIKPPGYKPPAGNNPPPPSPPPPAEPGDPEPPVDNLPPPPPPSNKPPGGQPPTDIVTNSVADAVVALSEHQTVVTQITYAGSDARSWVINGQKAVSFSKQTSDPDQQFSSGPAVIFGTYIDTAFKGFATKLFKMHENGNIDALTEEDIPGDIDVSLPVYKSMVHAYLNFVDAVRQQYGEDVEIMSSLVSPGREQEYDNYTTAYKNAQTALRKYIIQYRSNQQPYNLEVEEKLKGAVKTAQTNLYKVSGLNLGINDLASEIDFIVKTKDSIVVIDLKSSKKSIHDPSYNNDSIGPGGSTILAYSRKHKLQLALYRSMLSKIAGIEQSHIKVAVAGILTTHDTSSNPTRLSNVSLDTDPNGGLSLKEFTIEPAYGQAINRIVDNDTITGTKIELENGQVITDPSWRFLMQNGNFSVVAVKDVTEQGVIIPHKEFGISEPGQTSGPTTDQDDAIGGGISEEENYLSNTTESFDSLYNFVVNKLLREQLIGRNDIVTRQQFLQHIVNMRVEVWSKVDDAEFERLFNTAQRGFIERFNDNGRILSLSDFVIPTETNRPDYFKGYYNYKIQETLEELQAIETIQDRTQETSAEKAWTIASPSDDIDLIITEDGTKQMVIKPRPNPTTVHINNPSSVKTGDKLEFEVEINYDGEVLDWDNWTKTKYTHNSDPEIEHEDVPIAVYKTINGERVKIGYIHTMSYIRNKAHTDPAGQIAKMQHIRKKIMSSFRSGQPLPTASIHKTNTGWMPKLAVATRADLAFPQQGLKMAVADATGNFKAPGIRPEHIMKFNPSWKPIPGVTYVMLPVKEDEDGTVVNKLLPAPLFNTSMYDTERSAETNTIPRTLMSLMRIVHDVKMFPLNSTALSDGLLTLGISVSGKNRLKDVSRILRSVLKLTNTGNRDIIDYYTSLGVELKSSIYSEYKIESPDGKSQKVYHQFLSQDGTKMIEWRVDDPEPFRIVEIENGVQKESYITGTANDSPADILKLGSIYNDIMSTMFINWSADALQDPNFRFPTILPSPQSETGYNFIGTTPYTELVKQHSRTYRTGHAYQNEDGTTSFQYLVNRHVEFEFDDEARERSQNITSVDPVIETDGRSITGSAPSAAVLSELFSQYNVKFEEMALAAPAMRSIKEAVVEISSSNKSVNQKTIELQALINAVKEDLPASLKDSHLLDIMLKPNVFVQMSMSDATLKAEAAYSLLKQITPELSKDVDGIDSNMVLWSLKAATRAVGDGSVSLSLIHELDAAIKSAIESNTESVPPVNWGTSIEYDTVKNLSTLLIKLYNSRGIVLDIPYVIARTFDENPGISSSNIIMVPGEDLDFGEYESNITLSFPGHIDSIISSYLKDSPFARDINQATLPYVYNSIKALAGTKTSKTDLLILELYMKSIGVKLDPSNTTLEVFANKTYLENLTDLTSFGVEQDC